MNSSLFASFFAFPLVMLNYRVTGVLPDGDFTRSSFSWSTRCNNVLRIDGSTQLQMNLNYNSPTVSSQGRVEDFFSIDLAAKRTLFDRLLTITLQIRDLLGTAVMEGMSQGSDFYSYNYNRRASPLVMLNLRWNVNDFEQEEREERDSGRQDEGQNGSGDGASGE